MMDPNREHQIFVAEFPPGAARMKMGTGLRRIQVPFPIPVWLWCAAGGEELPKQRCRGSHSEKFKCSLVGAIAYKLPTKVRSLRGECSLLHWTAQADYFWSVWHSPKDAFMVEIHNRHKFEEGMALQSAWTAPTHRCSYK